MTSEKFSCFRRWYKNDNSNTVNYFSLYRYATRWDLFIIFVGVICTFFKAFAMPWTIIVYGEFTSLLVERMYETEARSTTPTIMLHWFGGGKILTNATMEENRHEIMMDSIAYCILTLLATLWQFIFGIFCVDCFNRTAIRQVTRLRVKYFESLMRQEIGWYDCYGGKTNFTIRITEDIEKIKSGIAEDVSHFLYLMFSFVIFVSISFIYGWQLTLIVISYLPLVFSANIIIGKLQATAAENELGAYAKAANVVEETLNAIRTVLAFGGETVEVDRYTKLLYPSKQAAKRKGLYSSISDGVTRFLFFVSCALSFWFGVQWVFRDRDIADKEYTPASLLIIFFSLVSAADNIAETTPFLLTFNVARGSAKPVFAVIDRISSIDPMDNNGEKLEPNDINGCIEFKNVCFNYPSRPDVQILQNFNLKIKPGQTVALVGNSGSGKSTCLHLLQRFYDPNKGEVLLNNRNLKSLNIHSLRESIATVCQEPVLFNRSIKENICYGNPIASDEQIIEAAKMSGAHDFVSELSLGYDTLVGNNGSQLSGGQKQRIAIARAMVQNPKILLLDEATSALDYQSEKYIQKTLDRASKYRTTIVVSHRLSAIKSADRILYLEMGQVVEDGTHEELLRMKGRYYEMVKTDNSDKDTKPLNRKRKSNTNSTYKEELANNNNSLDESSSDANSNESLVQTISEKDEKIEEEIKYMRNFLRILELAKPDWRSLAIATFSSFVVGAAFPLFSVVFAEVYGALSISDRNEALNEVFMWCVVFLALGVFIFIGAICQTYFFTIAGANLTQRIRSYIFEAMLKQECGWFDDHKNSVGALGSRLTSDAANLQTAIGYPLSLILQAISTFATGIIVSFMSSIKLSLVCLASVPCLLIAVFFESKHLAKSALSEKQAIEAGTKIASESILNIRTIASLRQENQMISRFVGEMERVERIALKKIYFRGFVNSFSTAVPCLAYAVALTYGGFMVVNGEIHYKNIVRISEAMLYGTLYMCQTLVFAPSISNAFIGAHGIFKIIDRKPLITSIQKSNVSTESNNRNNINFKDINFRYPTRPNIQVLDDFNLNIDEAKTVALVGHSGSGKSTCLQLLQRFYDPQYGQISIGKNDISTEFSIMELRKRLSIVSQEPVLFNRTIAENIAYGDNTRVASMQEIIEAAKIANIHNFIIQLPQGYETNIGSKATQLSGGQKQRIAIARALIRNPKILLLDEATSALDLHSEQVVQQALDSAQSGRTCIVIAHRLTTIENADLICVVQNGIIVEAGTHCELLTLNGAYTRLYNAQK